MYQQPVPYQYVQHAPPDPDAERLLKSRSRQLGFGIVLLIMSGLNVLWPLWFFIAALIMFGVGLTYGVTTGDIDTVLAGGLVGFTATFVYVATFPIIAVLALFVALRSGTIAKRLKPYGLGAVGPRVVAWIAFGLSTLNSLTAGYFMMSFLQIPAS